MRSRWASASVAALRLLFILGLIAAICVEGWYIGVLRREIEKQTEEIRSLSIRIQETRREQSALHDKMTALKTNGRRER